MTPNEETRVDLLRLIVRIMTIVTST